METEVYPRLNLHNSHILRFTPCILVYLQVEKEDGEEKSLWTYRIFKPASIKNNKSAKTMI